MKCYCDECYCQLNRGNEILFLTMGLKKFCIFSLRYNTKINSYYKQ